MTTGSYYRTRRRAPLQAHRARERCVGPPASSTQPARRSPSSTPSTAMWPHRPGAGPGGPCPGSASTSWGGSPWTSARSGSGTVRPGRTIELVEAVAVIAGRPAVRARAWLLATGDTTAVAGGTADRLPPPGTLRPWPLTSVWPGGYIASLDVRPLAPPQPGRATAWVSTGLDLVAGQSVGSLASYIALVDTANGIAVRQPPTAWMFPQRRPHRPPAPPPRGPLDRARHHRHLRPRRPGRHQHGPV